MDHTGFPSLHQIVSPASKSESKFGPVIYIYTRKVPGLAILAQDDDNDDMMPRVVFEIGTSESFNRLKKMRDCGLRACREYKSSLNGKSL